MCFYGVQTEDMLFIPCRLTTAFIVIYLPQPSVVIKMYYYNHYFYSYYNMDNTQKEYRYYKKEQVNKNTEYRYTKEKTYSRIS